MSYHKDQSSTAVVYVFTLQNLQRFSSFLQIQKSTNLIHIGNKNMSEATSEGNKGLITDSYALPIPRLSTFLLILCSSKTNFQGQTCTLILPLVMASTHRDPSPLAPCVSRWSKARFSHAHISILIFQTHMQTLQPYGH